MPRAFSSCSRSASMPVSARTSEVLPWSMWPAVPTIMAPGSGRGVSALAAGAAGLFQRAGRPRRRGGTGTASLLPPARAPQQPDEAGVGVARRRRHPGAGRRRAWPGRRRRRGRLRGRHQRAAAAGSRGTPRRCGDHAEAGHCRGVALRGGGLGPGAGPRGVGGNDGRLRAASSSACPAPRRRPARRPRGTARRRRVGFSGTPSPLK